MEDRVSQVRYIGGTDPVGVAMGAGHQEAPRGCPTDQPFAKPMKDSPTDRVGEFDQIIIQGSGLRVSACDVARQQRSSQCVKVAHLGIRRWW